MFPTFRRLYREMFIVAFAELKIYFLWRSANLSTKPGNYLTSNFLFFENYPRSSKINWHLTLVSIFPQIVAVSAGHLGAGVVSESSAASVVLSCAMAPCASSNMKYAANMNDDILNDDD